MSNWLKNSFVYLLCSGIAGLLAFLFLPFLSNYLTPEDYGQIALILLYARLMQPFLHMGSSNLAQIYYHEKGADHAWSFLRSAAKFLFILPLALLLIYLSAPELIERYVHLSGAGVILTLIFAILTAGSENLFGMQIISGQSKNYMISFLSKTFVDYGLSFILIAFFAMAWEGRILGSTIALVIPTLIYFFLILKKESKTKFHFREILMLGAPFMLFELSKVILNLSDRWFMEEMVSSYYNGIYSMAYSVCAVFLLFSNAILNSSRERIYSLLSEDRLKQSRVYMFKIIMILTLILIIMLLLIPLVYPLLIDEKFHEGMEVIPLILAGMYFWSIFYLIQAVINYYKLKREIIIISSISIVAALLMNYIFIKQFGWLGAAYATIVSYFLMMLSGIITLLVRGTK